VGRQSTREIASVVKGWIAELHQRRRDEELTTSTFRKIGIVLSLITLSFWGLRTESDGQQLRDTFRKVEQVGDQIFVVGAPTVSVTR